MIEVLIIKTSLKTMFCSNVLIMFHHTHGNKMNDIDDFKYVLVKILCCNMFDFFLTH